jgi:hypothetical protein
VEKECTGVNSGLSELVTAEWMVKRMRRREEAWR